MTKMMFRWRPYQPSWSLGSKNYQSLSCPSQVSKQCKDRNIIVANANADWYFRCFHSRFSWFTQLNKEEQYESNLLAKKEKALQKALKNKFEQELETLEKVQRYAFEILKNWTSDAAVMKVQSPRFNEIKEKIFEIHHDQIERTQEAIDVKRLLIIQNEKENVSALLKRFEEIRVVETKYQEDQIQTLNNSILDLQKMMLRIDKVYGKDSEDKNLELMKSFVHKHEKQLEEQILRHEEILQNYKKLLHIHMV